MNSFVTIVALLFSLASSVVCKKWVLVWNDEFDKPNIDKSKWEFQNGDGCPDLCGWGNNELEFYREENAFVENGNLVIEAKKEAVGGKQYTSAKMTTKGRGDWTFGKLEVRSRIAGTQGIWPAIWMLPTLSKWPWPTNGEIDMMENVGKEPNIVWMTGHFGRSPTDVSSKTGSAVLPAGQRFMDEFHIYAIEWRHDEIKWFVDGVLKSTITGSEVRNKGYIYPFNEQKFHLILNLAVGGTWPGSPDDTTVFPQRMLVDYVRMYKWQ